MENQLQVIVAESGLDTSKAQYILEQFQDYFTIAAEWEQKAKTLIVTRPDQKAEMEMARTGRLFLREKRIAVENARKKLKEQALREGKAIDGISNVLKALIVPVEEYLDKQEHFVEIQEEQKREAMRLEVEKRIADEEAAKLKAEAEERERIRQENERLKKEAEEREKKAAVERKRQEAKLAKERAAREKERQEAEEERRKVEEDARKEKEAREKALAKERVAREAEKKKLEEKARKEREAEKAKAEAERKEKERLAEMLKNQITCPKCGHSFNRKDQS